MIAPDSLTKRQRSGCRRPDGSKASRITMPPDDRIFAGIVEKLVLEAPHLAGD